MSELTLLILRIGFLALLWLFVLWVVYALRSDLFGAPARKMKTPLSAEQPQNQPAQQNPEQQTAEAAAPAAPQGTPQVAAPTGGLEALTDVLPSAGSDGPPKNLVILTGIAAGSSIPLDSGIVTIGRSPDSTLVIVDEYTSTYHARLDLRGSNWVLTDLDSTNGTKVNGTRM